MPRSDAFDLGETQLKGEEWDSYENLGIWLCQELDAALSARSGVEQEIQYAWALYQQDRTRGNRAPWPNAADLTSPLPSEYVDALHARLMTTIFTEPVWTVEGWGDSAKKAPFVEEFHQRAQEDERLQGYADEWILRALIEGAGILEVSEAFEMRREPKRMNVAVVRDEVTGLPVLDADGQPALVKQDDGTYREAAEGEPAAEVEVDSLEPVRLGPAYDVVPYLDFLCLPLHARDRSQVWGYAKRFYRRVPELKARAKAGVYDKRAVEEVGEADERQNTIASEAPAQPVITDQRGHAAQKELWEIQLLADLDGKGERWYRVTLHRDTRQILRLKRDDQTTRFVRFVPYPKPGTIDRGYSVITNKLMTVTEEDTARRNMYWDRMALKAGQPMLRRSGALWDPYEQPMGPMSVIDVMSMDEIQPLQGIEDVPQSLVVYGQQVRNDAERALGQNDVSIGQETQERRTLGEVQLVAGYAEVRVNVLLRRCQEALEELFQARHTIWKRVLQSRQGMPQLRSLMVGREAQAIEVPGVATDGTITPELLDGVFWGKPKGSVETADLNRQRQDFNAFLQTLPALMQVNKSIGAVLQTIPAARSLLKTALKVNRVQDIQSIVGTEANDVFAQMEAQQQVQRDPRMQLLMAAAGAGGGMPGMPGAVAPEGAAPVGPEQQATPMNGPNGVM